MAYLLQPNAVQTEFLQNVQKKVQINISIHYDYVSVCWFFCFFSGRVSSMLYVHHDVQDLYDLETF